MSTLLNEKRNDLNEENFSTLTPSQADMETEFRLKTKESKAKIQSINQEMISLVSFVDELRLKYASLKTQYSFQMDALVKLNEKIRSDLHQVDIKNDQLKEENAKLNMANKQLFDEKIVLRKDLDEMYTSAPTSLEEATQQLEKLKSSAVDVMLANQVLNRQLSLSSENIKYLQKVLQFFIYPFKWCVYFKTLISEIKGDPG